MTSAKDQLGASDVKMSDKRKHHNVFLFWRWRLCSCSLALRCLVDTFTMTTAETQILRWSDIDKVKFFGFGTGMYSALTLALHPMTVLKTRQQVLNTSAKDSLLHQHTIRTIFHDLVASSGVRGLFRGAGVVVSLAIPARVVYISALEISRDECQHLLDGMIHQLEPKEDQINPKKDQPQFLVPLVASISGGVAGGLAAMAAQCLAVPMDVISQRQMVAGGSAWSVARSAIDSGGWRALYRGFGLSLFSSLPTGSIWWATYGGCQHWIDLNWTMMRGQNENNAWEWAMQRGITQMTSGTSAAFVAATLTQPIDVTRTRLQVERSGSLSAIVSQLKASSGIRGFYRGLGPRVVHMSIWGTVLSSAYELLRHISRA